MSGELFNLSQWETVASGTPDGQEQLAYQWALRVVGEPLVYIVGALFELGRLAIGKPFSTKIRTPERVYRVTMTVEYADDGQQ